jgi:hypothetical protein
MTWDVNNLTAEQWQEWKQACLKHLAQISDYEQRKRLAIRYAQALKKYEPGAEDESQAA